MTRMWFAVLSVATMLRGAALAQGDPARAFDAATAAMRKPGAVVRWCGSI